MPYRPTLNTFSKDFHTEHRPIIHVICQWVPLAGYQCVCGPTFGDSFSLQCLVLLVDLKYSFITTLNIIQASTEIFYYITLQLHMQMISCF